MLICDDPDAPTRAVGALGHLQDPRRSHRLARGHPRQPRLKNPAGALQGQNSWPKDEHRLSRADAARPATASTIITSSSTPWRPSWSVEPGLDKKTFLQEIEDHVLAKGELVGTYQR